MEIVHVRGITLPAKPAKKRALRKNKDQAFLLGLKIHVVNKTNLRNSQ